MQKGEKIWPLVVVHVDITSPQAKSIFDIDTIGGLRITVEKKKKSNLIPRCRRCQKFNHTSNYFRASFVCAFCAKNHIIEECPIKDNQNKKPRYANCSKEHWATFRGCPKATKPKNFVEPSPQRPPSNSRTNFLN